MRLNKKARVSLAVRASPTCRNCVKRRRSGACRSAAVASVVAAGVSSAVPAPCERPLDATQPDDVLAAPTQWTAHGAHHGICAGVAVAEPDKGGALHEKHFCCLMPSLHGRERGATHPAARANMLSAGRFPRMRAAPAAWRCCTHPSIALQLAVRGRQERPQLAEEAVPYAATPRSAAVRQARRCHSQPLALQRCCWCNKHCALV